MQARKKVVALVSLFALVTAVWLLPDATASEEARGPARHLAEMSLGADRIDWQPAGGFEHLVLTVAGPEGLWLRKEFEASQPAFLSLFDENGQKLPDGTYTYELRPVSGPDHQRPLVQSGHFSIKGGSFVTATAKPPLRNVTANLTDDELIIQGNACIGGSCTTTDNDTPVLKLKGQNPNILFDDVEDPPSLVSNPVNDWAIRINPSNAAQFSIFDVDGGFTPFSILGGAPDNSLFIRDNGYVGLGTATPASPLHIYGSATTDVFVGMGPNPGSGPAMNVGYGGFSLGRGAGFLNVRPDASATAPNPSLRFATADIVRMIITNTGNVGIGTTSPSQPLHVSRSNGTAKVLVEETSGTTAMRNVLELRNNGGIQLLFNRTDGSSNDWQASNFNSTFEISIPGSSTAQFSLVSNGNLTISGTLTQMSDRAMKEAIVPVQPEEVLEKLVSLPISTWSRKDEDPKVRHLGPMAQDFSAIFGLGEDDRHIAPLDMAGVSMASIQALHGRMNREMAAKDAEISALRQELAALRELVSKLAEGEPAP